MIISNKTTSLYITIAIPLVMKFWTDRVPDWACKVDQILPLHMDKAYTTFIR